MNTVTYILNYLQDFNEASVVFRLIIATLMGAVIGLDRGATKNAAGLRTFTLVCLGSALAQIVDIQCIMLYGSGDPVRLAQGVINGIGFLGVGTIVVTGKSHIRGLTTAATLWTTAVLGISVGSGYLYSSIITFLLILFVVKVMYPLSRKTARKSHDMTLVVEMGSEDAFDRVMDCIQNFDCKVSRIQKQKKNELLVVEIEVELLKSAKRDKIVMELGKFKNVSSVEEIM